MKVSVVAAASAKILPRSRLNMWLELRLPLHRCRSGLELSAFSLAELLVVIAVVGILAALLLPTLHKSKASAQRIQCLSQLRQLGLATQLYWDENNGAAFRWRGVATNNGHIYWFGWLESGQEGQRRFDLTLGALAPFLGGSGVELCPSFNYLSQHVKLKATGASYGYGYNLTLSAPGTEWPLNIATIARPGDLALFADAAQVNTFQAPASPQRPMLEEFYFITTNQATTHFRHSANANVVFCDGHVAQEKPVPHSLDLRITREKVGWLRTEILSTP